MTVGSSAFPAMGWHVDPGMRIAWQLWFSSHGLGRGSWDVDRRPLAVSSGFACGRSWLGTLVPAALPLGFAHGVYFRSWLAETGPRLRPTSRQHLVPSFGPMVSACLAPAALPWAFAHGSHFRSLPTETVRWLTSSYSADFASALVPSFGRGGVSWWLPTPVVDSARCQPGGRSIFDAFGPLCRSFFGARLGRHRVLRPPCRWFRHNRGWATFVDTVSMALGGTARYLRSLGGCLAVPSA